MSTFHCIKSFILKVLNILLILIAIKSRVFVLHFSLRIKISQDTGLKISRENAERHKVIKLYYKWDDKFIEVLGVVTLSNFRMQLKS